MQRRSFLEAAGTAIIASAIPRVAQATGGDEVLATDAESVRVLLASGAQLVEPRPLSDAVFAWNGNRYRGSFAFVALDGTRRGLINRVTLDDYLCGVLGAEMSPGWPAAALRAQAVVARTYAMLKLRPDREYDVTAYESDQRYRGIDRESAPGRAAVSATSGTFVSFDHKPAHVAYSACCGGRTADSGDVWQTGYPYLPSRLDPNCAGTPDYRWRATVPYDYFARGLPLDRVGQLRVVELRGTDGSGRPQTAIFEGSESSVTVSARDLRAAAGNVLVCSTFIREIDIADDGRFLVISGNGRGHGVGMCQWGARMMAEKGASEEEIVAFYFPGTSLGHV